ncbi:Protein bfr2 [Ceratobasidium theobromae]|uniref:Protein BFR2 n=1 Tax=Ceratobasidium theobromae TaxID=1582974 RepID=A0A5N5QAH8_9AGAM|nr:Protein bfr2 [Ceratobasidium theobromae]
MPLSLAEQISQLEDTAPPDIDIERFDAGGEDGAEGDLAAGRDHYLDVGVSSLRKQRDAQVDPKYEGAKTTRSQLYEFDDVTDDEEQNDSSRSASEAESEGSASDGQQSDGEPSTAEDQEEEGEIDNNTPEDEDSADENEDPVPATDDLTAALKRSRQADRDKGRAIIQQRVLWDSLLEARIRLQKAATGSNRLPDPNHLAPYVTLEPGREAVQALVKEIAAFSEDMLTLRKRLIETNEPDVKMPSSKRQKLDTDDLEEQIQSATRSAVDIDSAYHPVCVHTLQKWSNKIAAVTPATLTAKSGKSFRGGTAVRSAVELVQDALGESGSQGGAKAIGRTRVRRSAGTRIGAGQDQAQAEGDAEVFDDLDFYQALLRDVIDSRTGAQDDWVARQQMKKTKKVVDTRASKGRKLRFEVHEKLQNFMVPVPTATWHEEQIDELFANLLGRQASGAVRTFIKRWLQPLRAQFLCPAYNSSAQSIPPCSTAMLPLAQRYLLISLLLASYLSAAYGSPIQNARSDVDVDCKLEARQATTTAHTTTTGTTVASAVSAATTTPSTTAATATATTSTHTTSTHTTSHSSSTTHVSTSTTSATTTTSQSSTTSTTTTASAAATASSSSSIFSKSSPYFGYAVGVLVVVCFFSFLLLILFIRFLVQTFSKKPTHQPVPTKASGWRYSQDTELNSTASARTQSFSSSRTRSGLARHVDIAEMGERQAFLSSESVALEPAKPGDHEAERRLSNVSQVTATPYVNRRPTSMSFLHSPPATHPAFIVDPGSQSGHSEEHELRSVPENATENRPSVSSLLLSRAGQRDPYRHPTIASGMTDSRAASTASVYSQPSAVHTSPMPSLLEHTQPAQLTSDISTIHLQNPSTDTIYEEPPEPSVPSTDGGHAYLGDQQPTLRATPGRMGWGTRAPTSIHSSSDLFFDRFEHTR